MPRGGRAIVGTRSEVEGLDGGRQVFVGPATTAAGGDAARCTACGGSAAENSGVMDVTEAGWSGSDRAGLPTFVLARH
jgi:hypothetical protein